MDRTVRRGGLAANAKHTMSDLKSPVAIWTKGLLFLVLGLAAAGLLLAEAGTFKAALLLVIAIWGFCRAYYFAFYVIEKYVDPGYRFSGLISFARYCVGRRGPHPTARNHPESPP